MAPSTDIKLHLPPDQYFSCNSCGKCCTTPWRVKVEPKKLAAIKTSQIYRKTEKQGYIPIEVIDEIPQMGRKNSGECHFLDESGCGLHSELGAAAKPSVCRLYPFNLVKTPQGYYVSLSFTCPAVLAGNGEPVLEQAEELKEVVQDSPYFQPETPVVNSGISVTQQREVSFEDYLQLESELLKIDWGTETVSKLLQLAIRLTISDGHSNLGQNGRALEAEVAALFPFFCANTISVLELDGDTGSRAKYAESLLQGAGTHSNLLRIPLPQFEVHSAQSLITKQVVDRYVKSLLWGKRLTIGPSLVTRLLMLAASISILFYYLDAKAGREAHHHFSFEDLEWGFDLIETNLFTHCEDLEPVFLEYEGAILAYSELFSAA